MTPADLIARSLESIGLAYVMQTNPAGHPFGAFTMTTPSGLQFPTTELAQGAWLNIGVYRVLAGPAHDSDLQLFATANRDWRFGRVFFNPQDQHFQIALGLDAREGVPPSDALRAVFHHLGDAVQVIHAYDVPHFVPPSSPVTMADVHAVLAQLGAKYETDPDSVGWGMLESTGARYSIQLQIAESCLLVRGIHPGDRPITVDRAFLDLVQQTNARLAAGTLQVDVAAGRLYYELSIPLAWWSITPERLQHWVDQVRSVMRHVEATF